MPPSPMRLLKCRTYRRLVWIPIAGSAGIAALALRRPQVRHSVRVAR